MTETQPISQLPWQVSPEEFMRAAAEISEGGACCMFVIDSSIPTSARSGYAALVIAYARADEPVCILEGGAAALLVRSGGVASAETRWIRPCAPGWSRSDRIRPRRSRPREPPQRLRRRARFASPPDRGLSVTVRRSSRHKSPVRSNAAASLA